MKKKLSLMLVDDEPIILKGLETTFDWDAYGYSIIGTARDGRIALDRIKEEVPDVVLTDMCMKSMDGIALIKECAIYYPTIKFVILSAYQEFEYAKQACELGVYSYLLKPISEEQLSCTMTSLYNECMGNRVQDSAVLPMEEEAPHIHSNTRVVERLSQALDYITKNLSDPKLTMAQVAKAMNYNYNYFGRLFKGSLGVSFNQYVCNMRLNRAKQLLLNHDMSILDVAYVIGIPSQSYFCTLFKNAYGVSPSEYRKTH